MAQGAGKFERIPLSLMIEPAPQRGTLDEHGERTNAAIERLFPIPDPRPLTLSRWRAPVDTPMVAAALSVG
jgi:hypothetical protein